MLFRSSVAWLVTSMYTLSWYDLIAWMPLAVLAANKLDRIMLVRITPLSLSYVPGRAIEVGPALDWTANRVRDTVSPLIQFAVLAAIVLWWRHPERPELFPRRAAVAATAPEPEPKAARSKPASSKPRSSKPRSPKPVAPAGRRRR